MRLDQSNLYGWVVTNDDRDKLRQLGISLVQLARAASDTAQISPDRFDAGRAFGLHEAVALMALRADEWGIQRHEIGLPTFGQGEDN